MALFIYTDNAELRQLIQKQIDNHRYTDSGFDIPMLAQDITPNKNGVATLRFQMKAAATLQQSPSPFLILPRSSISNSPFRMTNSVGLIDMGYRGELMAKVDVLDHYEPFTVLEGQRFFQLCRPDFRPWTCIQLMNSESELPKAPDSRGSGGFGSTG